MSQERNDANEWRTIARFIAVGALNSAFGYLAFALTVAYLPRPVALVAAYAASIVFNFHSTAIGVFHQYEYRLLAKFVAAYVVVYLFNLALLEALCHFGNAGTLVAQASA